MKDKNIIRQRMKETISKLSKPNYEDFSYKIAQRLFEEENWKQANVVGITISKPPEVDTYQIIRKAWEQGKQIVAPKCFPKEKKMSFRTITEFSQLESVYFGLLEPIEDETKEMPSANIDLLIVPGLAFTREGYRLGFGGGYYDRYLIGFQGETVSLSFHNQIVSNFPIEKHDIPVSKIITNKEVIKIR